MAVGGCLCGNVRYEVQGEPEAKVRHVSCLVSMFLIECRLYATASTAARLAEAPTLATACTLESPSRLPRAPQKSTRQRVVVATMLFPPFGVYQ